MVLKNISFEQLLVLFPREKFCRINKKNLIALDSVKFYRHNEVILSGAEQEITLALGDNFKKEFLEKTTA